MVKIHFLLLAKERLSRTNRMDSKEADIASRLKGFLKGRVATSASISRAVRELPPPSDAAPLERCAVLFQCWPALLPLPQPS